MLNQNSDYLLPDIFRLTYLTFTKPEILIERLIYIYVANTPIEPGRLNNWLDAIIAAEYLVSIVSNLLGFLKFNDVIIIVIGN